ncbi:hypothetical protein MASR2M70_05780 [Bacillota bacterium]
MNREIIAIITPVGFRLDWQPAREPVDESQFSFQKQLFEEWKRDPYGALFNLAFKRSAAAHSASVQFLKSISETFINSLKKQPDIEFRRENVGIQHEEEEVLSLINTAPFMNGTEYLDKQWIHDIWARLEGVFKEKIQEFQGSVAEYFASQNSDVNLMGRVFFHLVENRSGDLPFAFMATYASRESSTEKSKHLPLKNALIEFKNNDKKLLELLSTVSKAAASSPFVRDLHDSGDIFHPIGLTADEAYTFLKEIPLYEASGILCRIPNWWKNKSNTPRLTMIIGEKSPSHLGADAILSFDAQLSLGDEKLTIEEMKGLMAETDGLAFIKGKWIEIDHEKLKRIIEAYEEAGKQIERNDMTLLEAFKLQLNPSGIEAFSVKNGVVGEVSNGQWLDTVISGLLRPEKPSTVTVGEHFKATLRPYQERGLAWLNTMKTLGLGACLADDMGLGKTIQVIALLNFIRTKKQERNLLVVPASLIGNWVNEIQKFAPMLKYCILHPSQNGAPGIDKNLCEDEGSGRPLPLAEHQLYITTYGMLSRYHNLLETDWDTVIIDEAQAIKNPGTKQTKAVKQLKADFRIAMTGTPVENRLSDLWSIFDFVNRGLLGSAKEFTDFSKALKEEPAGYSRLKKVIDPFILRRLKTDKSIIADLPDKIEMKTYSLLSKKQAVLYDALVNDLRIKLDSAEEGIQRKGLVLSSIVKFKQICNHPDQYLGQTVYSENESGKYARLREICETIYEKRESVLVFTQFKEITAPLKVFLESIFFHEGLVIHGGTPVAKRRQIVEEFQSRDEYIPFLVLSLKAGGVGLNLTKANHVIHFDRWWNPAVEDQATDRAFRIGQQKNVIVHKFITKGTIEEKIDRMIADKVQLAKDIIPEKQENWITEMDNRQLMDLFRLER